MYHIAQRPDPVVEQAPAVHAEILGHRQLDRGDVAAPPDRLEQRVGEPQEVDVQHRLLTEKVIDAQDLILGEHGPQVPVEPPGRREVVAERLLDHHPRAAGQAGLGQGGHDRGEKRRRDLQVEHRMRPSSEPLAKPLVGSRIGEVPLHVGQPAGQPAGGLHVDRVPVRRAGVDSLAGVPAQLVVGPAVHGDADHGAAQPPRPLEVVERAEGHLARQVAADAEDDQRPGRCRSPHLHLCRPRFGMGSAGVPGRAAAVSSSGQIEEQTSL